MQTIFSKSTYSTRRAGLKKDLGSGLILLFGNTEIGMNYRANTFRFRQDSNFLYFGGPDRPGGLAMILDCETDEEFLVGREIGLDDVIWEGPLPTLAEQAASVGIEKVIPFEKMNEKIAAAKKSGRAIHFLPPYQGERTLRLAELLSLKPNLVEKKASLALIKAVIAQRQHKSAEEIEQMHEAVNITRAMHLAAMRTAKPGQMEHETVGKIHEAMLEHGAELAYGIIFSVNGQVLHNHHHGNKMQAGKLALADFGAENRMHYAGDITRTFPIAATFSSEQKAIYETVLKAENEVIRSLRIGKKYREYHLKAAKIILEGLKNLDLVCGDVAEMTALGVQGLFMPHGLGHMIGLDVHDMEDLGEQHVGYRAGLKRSTQLGLRSLRLARELETGFALTIEPGIYFIPELIEKWRSEGQFKDFIRYEKLEKWKNFGGVRIEDNVVMTEKGATVLGRPIPKTVAEVEAERAKAFEFLKTSFF